ncbi:alpha/beta fold hydrolase [Streptomyces sp. NPDC085927]|uniref:alpha/beta fold hydrolase n=1 Tax=Streptomyces sp. NPDC085927 TaxID=3365738 RepID=UPI0037D4922D
MGPATEALAVSRDPYRLHTDITPGVGLPVLLLHGFPDSSRLHDRLLPRLEGRMPAVRFDFLGWGKSGKPRGCACTAANQMGGLVAVADAVSARLDARRLVLVGHSYGGSMITNAATGNSNVRSLVYIAGFAPEKGESAAELLAKFPGSRLADAFNAVPIPKDQGAVDLYVKPDRFRDVFLSNRLSTAEAAVAAASQRPATPATSNERSGAPAWKTIPSWFLVSTDDRAIGTANLRFMAERARARTVEADAPHAACLTAPNAVTDLILDAAGTRSLAHTGSSARTAAAMSGAAAAIGLGTALLWSARGRRQSSRA